MVPHEKFRFQPIRELKEKIVELGANIHLSEDLSPLAHLVKVGSKTSPNAIAVFPMKGCDSEPDSSPNELVERRYTHFIEGGAGLLWWEVRATMQEGRANSPQMMLTKENVGKFAELLKRTNVAVAAANGTGHHPLNIVQLTYSGRYSRPEGHKGTPLVPQYDPLLDPRMGLDPDASAITGEYLDAFTGKYVQSTFLAKEAGFDGADIESYHRYLLSELLTSHTREGKYGGSFENRARFLRQTIRAVRETVGGDFLITCRFNVFGAYPYPYGFGVGQEDMWKFDPTKPMMFVKMLVEEDVDLLNNSAGNPYYIYPQVMCPFNRSGMGIPAPDECPLESVPRLFGFTRRIQKAAGDTPIIGSGYTWLHQYAPYAGTTNIADHGCSFMGLGRSSFAHPEAPHNTLIKGEMDSRRYCTTCSKCTQTMRNHDHTDCVIGNSKLYAPLYREVREEIQQRERSSQRKGEPHLREQNSRIGRVARPMKIDFMQRTFSEPVEGQILIRVVSSVICGSDLHIFKGRHPAVPLPVTIDHEFSGDIVAVGPGVTGLSEGDRVMLEPCIVCGACKAYRHGSYGYYESISFSHHKDDGAMTGCMMTQAGHVFRLPDDLSYHTGALIESLFVATHTVCRTDTRLGETVLVIGADAIGLLTAAVRCKSDASQVIIADHSDARLKLALELGAAAAVNSGEELLEDALHRLTGGKGVDKSFECVGLEATFVQAILSIRQNGLATIVGIFGSPKINIPADPFVSRETRVQGAQDYCWDLSVAIELSREPNLEKLVTHVSPLDDSQKTLEVCLDRSVGSIKVLLEL